MDGLLALSIAATALSDISYSAAFGLAVARLWFNPGEAVQVQVRISQATLLSTAGLLTGVTLQIYALAATMGGAASLSVARPQILPVISFTHTGRMLAVQGVLAATLVLLRRASSSRARNAPVLALLMFIAMRSSTGHAASQGAVSVRQCVQLVHLLSICTWSGAILAAGFVVVPAMLKGAPDSTLAAFLQKLSRTVTFALAGVALSGFYNSYVGLNGAFSPIVSSTWGRLLLIKLSLVGSALALGLWNRTKIRRESALSQEQSARLARTLECEAIVMLCILAVSAWLANIGPST